MCVHAHTHYAQTTAIPIVFSPSSYQLCEYVTASHNETLSDTARARTFLIKRQLSFPYHGGGGGSKVTLVQQRQSWSPPSIFINVTSQWPVTSLPLIAVSIVPIAEKPTMWVSSIFGNGGGLAHSTWDTVCGVIAQSCSKIKQLLSKKLQEQVNLCT